MYVLFVLLGFRAAWAEPTIHPVRFETPVYEAPQPGSKVLFYLHVGETISITSPHPLDFLEIRVKRKGKRRRGFVKKIDLEESHRAPRVERQWGVGSGYQYAALTQKGRSFTTDDQVEYKTTEYKSTMNSVLFMVQWKPENFWRLSLAMKKTTFVGSASNSVTGSVQAIELKQTFYSALLQRAWNPLPWKFFYLGAGGEIAKATSQELKFSGQTLAITDTPLPTYIGLMGFLGAQVKALDSMSVFMEAGYEMIMNQSPSISEYAVSVGIMYWPGW